MWTGSNDDGRAYVREQNGNRDEAVYRSSARVNIKSTKSVFPPTSVGRTDVRRQTTDGDQFDQTSCYHPERLVVSSHWSAISAGVRFRRRLRVRR